MIINVYINLEIELSQITLNFKDDMSSLIWTCGENHYFLIYSFPVSLLLKCKTPFYFILK